MITLTRLTGAVFALNPDLVERVDQTPDTVITLVDGTKYLVRESLSDITTAMRDYRAGVLAAASAIEGAAAAHVVEGRRLAAVRPDSEDAAVLNLSREES